MGKQNKQQKVSSRERVYSFIVGYIQKNRYAPSIREICAGTGLRSPSSVHSHLEMLKMMGQIEMEENTSRSIRLTGYSITKKGKGE